MQVVSVECAADASIRHLILQVEIVNFSPLQNPLIHGLFEAIFILVAKCVASLAPHINTILVNTHLLTIYTGMDER